MKLSESKKLEARKGPLGALAFLEALAFLMAIANSHPPKNFEIPRWVFLIIQGGNEKFFRRDFSFFRSIV